MNNDTAVAVRIVVAPECGHEEVKGKVTRGMCGRCYRRKRHAGEIDTRRQPVHERFWASVDRSGGPGACWPWTGRLNDYGYGKFGKGNGKYVAAHREAFVMEHGPITPGLEVDHQCHDPRNCAGGRTCPHRRCCNPAHLKEMTRRENVLRSGGMAAINMRKTECDHGHEFTEENTIVSVLKDGRTRRTCRKCHDLKGRADLDAARGKKKVCAGCGELRAARGMTKEGLCAGCQRVARGEPRGGLNSGGSPHKPDGQWLCVKCDQMRSTRGMKNETCAGCRNEAEGLPRSGARGRDVQLAFPL